MCWWPPANVLQHVSFICSGHPTHLSQSKLLGQPADLTPALHLPLMSCGNALCPKLIATIISHQAIESFALTVKEIAQMLQSFGMELAETELPEDMYSIERILALRTEKYYQLKVGLSSSSCFQPLLTQQDGISGVCLFVWCPLLLPSHACVCADSQNMAQCDSFCIIIIFAIHLSKLPCQQPADCLTCHLLAG